MLVILMCGIPALIVLGGGPYLIIHHDKGRPLGRPMSPFGPLADVTLAAGDVRCRE
jgi:hypothetical protein